MNPTYDPMRKQGAILLGNGGDNSVGSQGTFYEGAVTAAGTYPANATDQLVQSNIVAARYGVAPLTMSFERDGKTGGVQTFTPGSSREMTVTFTNSTDAPVAGLSLSMAAPGAQWSSVVSGTTETAKTFAEPIGPRASVSATFKVTSGPATSTAIWSPMHRGRTRPAPASRLRQRSKKYAMRHPSRSTSFASRRARPLPALWQLPALWEIGRTHLLSSTMRVLKAPTYPAGP